jgi:hypothetical protein
VTRWGALDGAGRLSASCEVDVNIIVPYLDAVHTGDLVALDYGL